MAHRALKSALRWVRRSVMHTHPGTPNASTRMTNAVLVPMSRMSNGACFARYVGVVPWGVSGGAAQRAGWRNACSVEALRARSDRHDCYGGGGDLTDAFVSVSQVTAHGGVAAFVWGIAPCLAMRRAQGRMTHCAPTPLRSDGRRSL